MLDVPATELGRRIGERVREVFPDAELGLLVARLAAAAGPDLVALVFFGSRKSGARTDPWSAYDLFVVVEAHRPFFEALQAAGLCRRSPALMAAVSSVLPPSQVSVCLEGQGPLPLRAKCSVLTLGQLRRETGPQRRDHFCVARLFQPTQLMQSRDARASELVLDAIENAHRATFEWARPGLAGVFDAESYTRRLLQLSMGSEIRPETGDRAAQLWDAQREYHRAVYPALLDELADRGQLRRVAGGFELAHPATRLERLRGWAYFRWSLLRATLRWAKHVVTFEDWLDYLVHKVERHREGPPLELSARERRHPLVFLWPRLLRFLREKRRAAR